MTADSVALVCPLDWGIGHATRCIPVIENLQDCGWRVIVAAGGRPLEFYKHEYPGLELLEFPGHMVRYPGNGRFMAPQMALRVPAILSGIRKEHAFLADLVEKTGARLVISDNRYGCWHPQVFSVFMTHQLNIQTPRWLNWTSPVLRKVTRHYISRYNECWVPDTEDEGGISGSLSHAFALPPNTHFIGPLTRLSGPMRRPPDLPCEPAEIFVMLSGPEPQRSILESIILSQLEKVQMTAIIAGGKPGSGKHEISGERIHIFPHLETALMKYYIEAAEYVICRSGYSTLMDLAALGKPAIIIPTPGQTEQEYLARRMSRHKVHHSVFQHEFDLMKALADSSSHRGMKMQNDYRVLKQRLKRISTQAFALRAR